MSDNSRKSTFSSKKSSFKVSFNEIKKKRPKKVLKNKIKKPSSKKKLLATKKTQDTAVTSSKVLHKTIPKYPYKSRKYHEEGVVLLRVFVSSTGKAMKSEIIKGSGFDRLDNSAVSAAMSSEYESATKNAIATDSVLELEFKFELTN
jgi:TonB family protein